MIEYIKNYSYNSIIPLILLIKRHELFSDRDKLQRNIGNTIEKWRNLTGSNLLGVRKPSSP